MRTACAASRRERKDRQAIKITIPRVTFWTRHTRRADGVASERERETRSFNPHVQSRSRQFAKNKVYTVCYCREQEKLCLAPRGAVAGGVHPSIQFLTTCESELCIRGVIPGV